MTNQRASFAVRTLLGASGFDTSLICLRSLVEYSADPVHLVVHEDGTLTEEHKIRLLDLDAAVEMVDRKSADETVLSILAKHPRCRAFRQTEMMALKLFDISLLSAENLAYCDSDILFLRRFQRLFNPAPDTRKPLFMTDVGHAYAVRPWRLRPFGPVWLLGRINAGITVAPRGFLDLDFLEWLLGVLAANSVFTRRRYWTEQTCWAALAARTGAGLLDSKAVVMATRTMTGYSAESVAIHFVATYRDKLSEFVKLQRSMNEAPVTVEISPGLPVSSFGMIWSDIRRRMCALK